MPEWEVRDGRGMGGWVSPVILWEAEVSEAPHSGLGEEENNECFRVLPEVCILHTLVIFFHLTLTLLFRQTAFIHEGNLDDFKHLTKGPYW